MVVCQATVEVEFYDAGKTLVKEVPAHYEERCNDLACRPHSLIKRLVPDDMEGWKFLETMHGKWYAHKEVFRDW